MQHTSSLPAILDDVKGRHFHLSAEKVMHSGCHGDGHEDVEGAIHRPSIRMHYDANRERARPARFYYLEARLRWVHLLE